jgi:hypothetical protein
MGGARIGCPNQSYLNSGRSAFSEKTQNLFPPAQGFLCSVRRGIFMSGLWDISCDRIMLGPWVDAPRTAFEKYFSYFGDISPVEVSLFSRT